MKIREMIEREEYIKNTIDKFSKEIKENTDFMRLRLNMTDNEVVISKTTCRQIARCLDWLEAIFKQNIDSISVYDVSIKNLPDY